MPSLKKVRRERFWSMNFERRMTAIRQAGSAEHRGDRQISAEPPGGFFSAEEKIRIVLEGLRGEDSIAELRFRLIVTSRRDTMRQISSICPVGPDGEQPRPIGRLGATLSVLTQDSL